LMRPQRMALAAAEESALLAFDCHRGIIKVNSRRKAGCRISVVGPTIALRA